MVHWGLDIGTTDTEAVSLTVQEGGPALYKYLDSLDIGITGVSISVQGLDIRTKGGVSVSVLYG